MRKTEADIECERLLFDFGRLVLGKNSGGLIKRLMQEMGIGSARIVIKMAAEKSEPREYVAAALNARKQNKTAEIGERVGKYVWNGTRWAEG